MINEVESNDEGRNQRLTGILSHHTNERTELRSVLEPVFELRTSRARS
jgi:hypothetical protein